MSGLLNLGAAEAYDAAPYDYEARANLNPASLFAQGLIYGCNTARQDVLDLGCGSGPLLALAAQSVAGRLVGTDISQVSCERTRARLAPYGDRADVICADLLDLTPERLGQFDLIYNIGVIYVTPPHVQRHLLSLIAACLRPGGLAVISFYSGPAGDALARFYRIVASEVTPGLGVAETVRQGRLAAEALARRPETASVPLIDGVLQEIWNTPDDVFFHHLVTPNFETLHPLKLASELSAAGVDFLTYLEPTPASAWNTSLQRAREAEIGDMTNGSYRHAIFGKGASAPSPSADGLEWRSDLRPDPASLKPDGAISYTIPGSPAVVGLAPSLTRSAIDTLSDGPASFGELIQKAARSGMAVTSQSMETARIDFLALWGYGFIEPVLAEPTRAP